ncbi:uncharacterized protein LOC122263512 [Penaeus japonicus]|uniref:uncharacterized protein LOC122263512 n=1 Tax=Penaeus japonicus TaxID=27405 RepID=UPI001C716832|nr:uncharacterized protein LOC122263512 [Penaeus japonicus]
MIRRLKPWAVSGQFPPCISVGVPHCSEQLRTTVIVATPRQAKMLSLLIALLAGSVAGLEVGPVSIVENNTYISYGLGPSENNSVIVCTYTLDAGQAVSKVLWEILKDEAPAGTFEWTPNSPGTATGLLENKVNLDRDDSDLELTSLAYDLSANYSCTVTTKDGSAASAKEEVLIIDTTSNHIYEEFLPSEKTCSIRVSVRYFPVFPEPTVAAGMYSEKLEQYITKVDNWVAKRHPNGSVGYSFTNYTVQIDESIPDEANFRTQLGVTKSDGTYISQSRTTAFHHFQHSCKVLPVGENQTVSYNSDEKTCYGEPYSPGQSLEATVTCASGYISSGNLTSVTLVCESANETYHEWIPKDEGYLPEDLLCASGGPASTATSCYALLMAMLLLCLHGR